MPGDADFEARSDFCDCFVPTYARELAAAFRTAAAQWMEHALWTIDPFGITFQLGAQRTLGEGVTGRAVQGDCPPVIVDRDLPGTAIGAIVGADAVDCFHQRHFSADDQQDALRRGAPQTIVMGRVDSAASSCRGLAAAQKVQAGQNPPTSGQA